MTWSGPKGVFVASLVVAACGCKTSPKSYCEHKLDLAEAYGKFADREAPLQKCIAEVEAVRALHPKETDCYLSCARDKRTLPEFVDCEPECGLEFPKSKDEAVGLPDELPPDLPSAIASLSSPPPSPSASTSASASASTASSASAPVVPSTSPSAKLSK